MKKILISGYYGFGNAGDELVLQEIVKNIEKYYPECSLTVLSADPEDTKQKMQVRAVNRWNILALIASLIKTDLLISGGGSLLQDKTSKNGILYYLGIICMGLLFRKKVYVLSQGIGPIDVRRNRRLTKWILNKVTYVSVRDSESKEYLKELGLARDIVLSADPVFLMEQASEQDVADLKKDLGLDQNKRLITIALREWDHISAVTESVVEFLENLPDDQYQIRFVGLHYPHDIKMLQAKLSGTPYSEWIINKPLKEEQLVSLIAGSYLVIAMRLHALIIAASQNVDFIAISYDPKVTVLDMEMYQGDLQMTTETVTAENLLKKWVMVKKKTAPLSVIKERAVIPFFDLGRVITGGKK